MNVLYFKKETKKKDLFSCQSQSLHFLCCFCVDHLTFLIFWDRLKAARARKLLQKKAALKEEKKAAALAAGLDWQSDESDDEPSVK